MGEGGDNTAPVPSLGSVEELVARGSVVEVELVRDDIRLSSLCTAERLELRVELLERSAPDGVRVVEWLASDGVRPVERTASDGVRPVERTASDGVRPGDPEAGLGFGPTSRLSISSSEALTKAKFQKKAMRWWWTYGRKTSDSFMVFLEKILRFRLTRSVDITFLAVAVCSLPL